MFRKELMAMLLGNPMSVTQIARIVGEHPSQVADDLRHLVRSLKHSEYRTIIEPARCRTCGFTFGEDKLSKPGKCPSCRGTRIYEAQVGIIE